MKNSSGCSLFFTAIVLLLIGSYIIQTPVIWPVVILLIAAIVVTVIARRRAKEKAFQAALENAATIMDGLADGTLPEPVGALALQKDEKLIYSLPLVGLTEYQSTGSSYSGMNAGVSFPLFGRVRGNVGGQGGQILKNPEQLMLVDQGIVMYTNQRIIFSGAKLVRDWDLGKIVSLEAGANGLNVKLAVSNRDRTSGLQALTIFDFGPGYLAGYVFTLQSSGEGEAKNWARNIAKQLREALAEALARSNRKAIEPK